jgi:hypothetical protein
LVALSSKVHWTLLSAPQRAAERTTADGDRYFWLAHWYRPTTPTRRVSVHANATDRCPLVLFGTAAAASSPCRIPALRNPRALCLERSVLVRENKKVEHFFATESSSRLVVRKREKIQIQWNTMLMATDHRVFDSVSIRPAPASSGNKTVSAFVKAPVSTK